MVRIIEKFCFNVDKWEVCQYIIFKCIFQICLNSWDVFMWNYFIDNCIFKFKVSVFFVWFEFDLNVFELIVFIRLMYEFIFNFCIGMECFMVCNLRGINIGFYFKFVFYMVNNDIKVKFIYIRDDCLVSFWVCLSMECRIFFSKFC